MANHKHTHTIAAIDLGSNSFHMIVANVHDGQIQVLDRIKEMVQLGAGLDAKHQLATDVAERALACLERFGQRLRDLPHEQVRAVGTNTLRQIRDGGAFLSSAQVALGHPIDIIAGREEARLVYSGVAHTLTDSSDRRLVIDIGGGSTEVIIGHHFEAEQRESLYMGCVNYSRRFFPNGEITRENMKQAEITARLELKAIAHQYKRLGWDIATGASGTIGAIANVIAANDWSDGGITPAAMKKLRKAILAAGHINNLKLVGLRKERRNVFPGGFAVLSACFESLGIGMMNVSDGALREGLLYELVGRMRHEDGRATTVKALRKRFMLDNHQASRVERTAGVCCRQVVKAWQLNPDADHQMLMWAAKLHEIGLALAHNQYHKHGAYLLENSDMPGFTHLEQTLLATLVRGHRRKFPLTHIELLPTELQDRALKLTLLLRLAVLLHRGRSDKPIPEFELIPNEQALTLIFPNAWLDEHPLTAADLEQEVAYLKDAGIKLLFK